MTVFAIFTYTEFFKHKSAEGEKMNKKTTGIIAYITWIGLIVAFCAGDKEGAKFHLNQALVITLGWITKHFCESQFHYFLDNAFFLW